MGKILGRGRGLDLRKINARRAESRDAPVLTWQVVGDGREKQGWKVVDEERWGR